MVRFFLLDQKKMRQFYQEHLVKSFLKMINGILNILFYKTILDNNKQLLLYQMMESLVSISF